MNPTLCWVSTERILSWCFFFIHNRFGWFRYVSKLWVEKNQILLQGSKNAKAGPAVLLLPDVGNISVTRGPGDPDCQEKISVRYRVSCVCERETESVRVCLVFLRTAADQGPYRLRKFVANQYIAVTVCTVWSSVQRQEWSGAEGTTRRAARPNKTQYGNSFKPKPSRCSAPSWAPETPRTKRSEAAGCSRR